MRLGRICTIEKLIGFKPGTVSVGLICFIGSLGRFIDDPRAALPREVPPDPLDGDEKALLEIDEEIDMNDRPRQPGRPALHRPPSEIEDSSVAADHRRIAAIFEPKTCHGSSRSQAFSRVCALLLGDLRETGQKLSIRPASADVSPMA